MSITNPDESAFPEIMTTPEENLFGKVYGNTYSSGGLTIREFFAGLGMQGMLAHGWDYQEAVITAVKSADALVAELNKNNL